MAAAASASRRWGTGRLDVCSTSSTSASDSDSDAEDAADPPTAVQLFSLPTAGGLRARRDSGPVQLPTAGGGSDSDDDDSDDNGFGESVVPLFMPTRCPSRRDSRRCGFGHEISTATAHKQEDMETMRSEAEAERLQRRRAEQTAQEEAERKAKVQEEGICVSEIVSLFSTTRPEPGVATNPTLSPAAAALAADDHRQTEEEPSPPWSDGDVADRAPDEEEDSSDTEDHLFGQHEARGRRKSVVQFPGWSSKADGASSTSKPAERSGEATTVVCSGAENLAADAMSVQDLEDNDEGKVADAPQSVTEVKPCTDGSGSAANVMAGTRSVEDTDREVGTAAAEMQPAQQQEPAKVVAAQRPPADESSSCASVPDAADNSDRADATAARQAFASGADWAESVWDEGAEMEFVDEIRARQIEQLVRSGRMPAPAPPSGFQSARAVSRERDGRPNGGRSTGRGIQASAAVPAAAVPAAAGAPAGSAGAVDGGMMPRPPPKRAGSPAHNGRRPAPPPKAPGHSSGRVMSGRTVRGRTVAATAAAAPVCV